MKFKRLLLLLCLLVTAGSAAWADIANGTCQNGSWVIDNSGKLTVNINGKMKDYGEGKAPWYEYADRITAIHISSGCTNIGRNGFYGLYGVTSVTGGENVEACAMYSFQNCGGGLGDEYVPIPSIYFPKCSYVGECAFAGCSVKAISLPKVEKWKIAAITGERATYGLSDEYNMGRDLSGCDFVDLGSKTEFLRPGSLMGPYFVFCQNPTPPEWARLYDKDEGPLAIRVVTDIVAGALTWGLGTLFSEMVWLITGFDSGREYEYPFGDNPDVKFIVPQEYLQTYKDYYPSGHPEVSNGYMCAYYTDSDDHSKKGKTASTGKLCAGAPIYENGKLIGGWYVEDSELHVALSVNEMPKWTQVNAPWKSVLGSVQRMYINANCAEFKIPDYCFTPVNSSNNLLKGIKYLRFTGMGSMVIGEGAFNGSPDLVSVENDDYSSSRQNRMPLKICKRAFMAAPNFTTLRGFDVTELGESAFYGCTKFSNNSGYTTFSIKDIPEAAFYGCQNLDKFDFSWIRTTGKKAFKNSGLDDVNLSNATSVGEEAFAGSGLNKIVFGPSTQGASVFGSKCFAGCTHLGNIDVSSVLASTSGIASSTFEDVTLSDITLNVGPRLYGDYYENDPIFGQMKVNKLFDWPVGSPGEGWEIIRGRNEEDGVLRIYRRFNDFTNEKAQPWHNYREYVKTVDVDYGIDFIGPYEFADLPNVVSVRLPYGIKTINSYAFKDCPNLKDIRITGVETLGDNVFEGCSGLEYLDLGTGLKKAGDYIFKNCTSLALIDNKDNTPAEVSKYTFADIGSQAYQLRGGRRKAVSGQAAVTLNVPDEFVTNYIIDPDWGKFHIKFADSRGTWEHAGPFGDGTWILYDDSTMVVSADKGPGDGEDDWKWSELRLTSEVVKKVKRIEFSGNLPFLSNCFWGCENLQTVSLCPSIKTLGNSCFWGCEKLRDINLDNVETIEEAAFGHTGLTTVDLSKVKYLRGSAFTGCPKLVVAKLGSQCEVGKSVFNHCDALTAVDLGDVNLDNSSSCFSSCSSLKYVAYNGLNLPHNIFYNCTSLTSVKLGPSLRSIYWDAFEGCTALDSVICESPTPPTLPKGVTQDVIYWDSGVVPIYGPEYDVWAFNGLTLSDIHLFVAEDVIPSYRAANIWKEMNIEGGEDDAEPILPTGGSLGSNGTWYLDEDGTLVIDASGDIQAFDSEGKPWSDTFSAWAGFIKTVIVSDGVTSIPDNFFGGEYFSDISTGIETVKLGYFLQSVGKNSLSFSGIKDVYVYSKALLTLDNTTFDLDAAVSNGATLHVIQAADNSYRSYYLNYSATSRFPYIVADLDLPQSTGRARTGTLGTKGYWTFADGVLTVTYNGAMPTITKTVTDPEQAFRFKWIDFLSEIKEIDVIGKDVEIQPYFLYYEGDGDKGQHPDDHVKTIKLGEGVKSIGRGALSLYELKNLYCYSEQPPTLPAAINSDYKAFWKSRITANLTFLHVPKGAKSNYGLYNTEWANFANMIDDLYQELAPRQDVLLDFEKGNMGQVVFVNDSQYPWTVTYEDAASGSYSMISGNKGVSSSSSAITAYFLYDADGVIVFDAKFMGEGSGEGWDKCRFYIDGVQQFSYGARGRKWFVNNSFPVSAGMHTFKWEYTKDSSTDPDGDAFYVDNIYFLQNEKDEDMITGVDVIDHSPLNIGHWFDISGRKLDGKPTQSGVYINGGRKVVIK